MRLVGLDSLQITAICSPRWYPGAGRERDRRGLSAEISAAEWPRPTWPTIGEPCACSPFPLLRGLYTRQSRCQWGEWVLLADVAHETCRIRLIADHRNLTARGRSHDRVGSSTTRQSAGRLIETPDGV